MHKNNDIQTLHSYYPRFFLCLLLQQFIASEDTDVYVYAYVTSKDHHTKINVIYFFLL